MNKKRSKKIQKKYDERKKNAKIASILEEQFQQGKLLGESLAAFTWVGIRESGHKQDARADLTLDLGSPTRCDKANCRVKVRGCSPYLQEYLLGLKCNCCFIISEVTPLLAGRGNLFLELELVHVPARLPELIIPGWPLRNIMELKTCKMSKDPRAALCVRRMFHKLVTASTGFKFWGIVQCSEVFW